MTSTPTLLSDLAHEAIYILENWKDKDFARLSSELDRTTALFAPSQDMPSEEAERRELLHEILKQMRQSLARTKRPCSPDNDEMEVYLRLLQHLTTSTGTMTPAVGHSLGRPQ